MFRRLVIGVSVGLAGLVLVGCASSPSPQYINGSYFMTGDDNCKLWRANGPRRIMCYTSKDEFVEGRWAMTQDEMQMYQAMAAQRSAETAAVMNQLEVSSRQLNQQSQQILQQSQGYQAPAVNSYQQPNNTIRCISAGIYTNCRY